MTPETPHLCSVYRMPFNDHETVTAEQLMSSENPCMFVPASAGNIYTYMGRAEILDNMLFIGYDVDIKMGDRIYDEGKAESWVVIKPPMKYENPATWETDHQQCIIERIPIQ